MNLPMPVAVAIMLSFGALLLAVMWRGWRGQRRRGAARLGVLVPVPDDAALGTARTGEIEGTYVSTTGAGDWLDRVAASDLGHRAKAVVQVFDTGVLVARSGATDVFVPAADLRGTSRTAGMAGKYVGGEGIVQLLWTARSADGTPVALDTGVRTLHKADRALLVDAVDALVSETAGTLPGASTASADSRTDLKESE